MRRLGHLMRRTFVTLTLSFAVLPVCAGDAVPVMVGGLAELDACGGLGEVRGLNPRGDAFLAVRKGPGRKYPMIDRLYNGNRVYFCDDYGEWIGIVYGEPAQDCGVSSPLPKQQPYKGPCESGWVHRNWLVLIAG
jgi:hypothetical protein